VVAELFLCAGQAWAFCFANEHAYLKTNNQQLIFAPAQAWLVRKPWLPRLRLDSDYLQP